MKRVAKTLGLALGIFATVGLVSAIASQTSAAQPPSYLTAQSTSTNFVFKMRLEGGFCRPGGCFSEVTILPNGTYQYRDGLGKKASGSLPAQEVRILQQQIAKANFRQIKSKPFQGTCPIAWDGPEGIYRFRTTQGTEVLSQCKYAIDPKHPLFKQADKLYRQVMAKVFPAPIGG